MKYLPKVFISEPIDNKGIEMLRGKTEIIVSPDTKKETALSLIGDADAVILRATTTFDREVIEKAHNLKIIVRTGIGVDNVDLKFAGEKGIFVCNTPGTNDETVAEHVVAMILAFAKQVILMDQAVRNQNWKERFSPNQIDVKNKRVGIIGYGNIGFATAHFCKCLGMQVTAYDPFITHTGSEIKLTDSIETIFRESDFVTLHCPSTPLTRKFIGARYLGLMKKGAYLINTSRGDLIDETALVTALQENRISGAALDVFKEEPLAADSQLLQFPNVILSPHVAGSTKESNERIAMAAAQAVLDTINGKIPLNICNMEYYTRLNVNTKSA
jgi:D-3-phosphoglycerate dehydrogenase